MGKHFIIFYKVRLCKCYVNIVLKKCSFIYI
jgi:hypothetical protein